MVKESLIAYVEILWENQRSISLPFNLSLESVLLGN